MKSELLPIPFATLLLTLLQGPPAAPAVQKVPIPLKETVDAAPEIKAADMKSDLTYLASDELEGRATGSPGQQKAAAFLAKRFADLKLEAGGDKGTYLQKLEYTPRKRRKSPNATDSAPASEPAPVDVYNVIGILRGTDPALGAIVFSAHYDHLGRGRANKDGDDIFNGADDDGSGTVSVLALAKAYVARKVKPKRTIVFACFTGEEIGGLGSRGYVINPPVPLNQTICNINLEMLGRSHGIGPKKAWVTGWEVSTLGPILEAGGKSAGVEIYADPYPEQMYYMRSDNVQFVTQGVIGQTVSAGSNHPQYHTQDDEVELIEFENMELIIKGVFYGSSMIADGMQEPKMTGASLMPANGPSRRKPTASKPAEK